MPRYEWKAKVVAHGNSEQEAREVIEDAAHAINKGENLRLYVDDDHPEVEED